MIIFTFLCVGLAFFTDLEYNKGVSILHNER